MHHKRIGRRDIQTRLYNRCGQQYVILPVIKRIHPLIEGTGRHLPVRDDIFHLGHLSLQKLFDLGQIRDFGHYIKRLPPAIMLAQQRLAHHHRIKRAHISANGQPVDRRRRNNRQIPHPRKGQLQRPWNGRRSQGQHVNITAQLLEPLFVGHTKALLFIHNQQPKVFEPHGFGQHCMGTNHNIHSALGQTGPRFTGRFSRDKPRERSNFDRKAAKPLLKRFGMLARQQGRRRNHSDLHAAHRRDKGRAHRHFGFAKSDIPANQTIHRHARGNVTDNIRNGAELIVRLGIGEARAKRVPHPFGRLKDRRMAQGALCGDFDQPFGHIADTLFEAGFLRLPRPAAKFI